MKLLIIDDEPDILEFLSYNFRKKGMNVTTAKNGLEGLKMAEEQLPDMIISDILMPEMDGIEFCSQLRKKDMFKKTPLIFLTAVNDDYKVIYAMDSGADQYASKPIRFEYLYQIVDQLSHEKGIMA